MRAIRQVRYERSDAHDRGAYEAICDTKAADTVQKMITELAEAKSIDAPSRRFTRPGTGELPAALSVACGYRSAPVGRWCPAKSTGQPMRRGQRYHPSRLDAATARAGDA